MPERIQLSPELVAQLSNPDAVPRQVILNNRQYTVERPVGAGFKGVVWKVIDSFGMSWALKLCTPADYESRSYMQEVSRASKLRPYPQFAQINDAGIVVIELGNSTCLSFVVFLEEWEIGRAHV